MKHLPVAALAATALLAALEVRAQALTTGKVVRVDRPAARVTLAHGPIASLGLPAMTLTYRAQPPSLLDKVEAGQRVRFAAERRDGVYTVTRLEVIK